MISCGKGNMTAGCVFVLWKNMQIETMDYIERVCGWGWFRWKMTDYVCKKIFKDTEHESEVVDSE